MGLLGSFETLPYLLAGPFAGIWVDRLKRRKILVAVDLGRALLLLTVPVMAYFHLLYIQSLYILAFCTGLLTLIYDVTEGAYLPSLVGRENLVEGNSRLAATDSLAEVGGPGLAGALVQLIGPAYAIALDGLSYIFSAAFLSSIPSIENEPPPPDPKKSLWVESKEAVAVVLGNPLLRAVAGTSATLQLFGGIFSALFILFVVRVLNMNVAIPGLVYAVGSLSGLLFSFASTRLTKRFGNRRLILITTLMIGIGWLVVSIAGGTPLAAFGIMILGAVIFGAGNTLYNICTACLVQIAIPDRLLGRVNASLSFLMWGTWPVGTFLGGVLGQLVGVRTALLIGGFGMGLALIWILLSPLRNTQEVDLIPGESMQISHLEQ